MTTTTTVTMTMIATGTRSTSNHRTPKRPRLSPWPFYIHTNPWQKFLVSPPARPATSAIAPAATGPSPAPTASTIPSAAARPPTAPATISAMRTIALRPVAAANMRYAVAVEVRLALSFVGEIATTFNHHRACRCRGGSKLALRPSRHGCTFRPAASHLRALLFQNRFAR